MCLVLYCFGAHLQSRQVGADALHGERLKSPLRVTEKRQREKRERAANSRLVLYL